MPKMHAFSNCCVCVRLCVCVGLKFLSVLCSYVFFWYNSIQVGGDVEKFDQILSSVVRTDWGSVPGITDVYLLSSFLIYLLSHLLTNLLTYYLLTY